MNANRTQQRGSALIIVMFVAALALVFFMAITTVSQTSSRSAFEANTQLSLLYSAEAGLERAKQIVMDTTETVDTGESVEIGSLWLSENADEGPVTWESTGLDYFVVGGNTVKIYVTTLNDGWYKVSSSATDGTRSITIASTSRGSSFWSDYARFVSQGVLNIGNYATYGGKVHCNSNINVNGSYVTFMDDVTAAGKISPYTSKNYPEKNTQFMKNATSGVAEVELPDADTIAAKFKDAPEGALIYNAQDAEFVQKIQTNGSPSYTPSDTDVVSTDITFDCDTMTVVTTVYNNKGKLQSTMTETDVAIEDDKAIYVSGDVTVSGNISSRTSILTPQDIYIDGPIRYVDDDGGHMWVLADVDTGEVADFSKETNAWSTMGNWTGSDYEYKIADDWYTRDANADREKPPVLGLMSGSTIYVTGDSSNRELHAALFTSGDVIRPKVTGQKKNLYIHGSIITAGTNPLSSYFSYRCYAYDPNLRKYPPPEFEQNDDPAFCNWHIEK